MVLSSVLELSKRDHAIDGIMLKSQKIIIPKALQHEMPGKIYTGHMDVQKCKERACDVLFWPEMCKNLRRWWRNV